MPANLGFRDDFQNNAYKGKLLKILEFKNEKKLCDVMFAEGNSVIYAHSCVLAASSPVFLDKFSNFSSHEWSFQKPLKFNLSNITNGKGNSKVNCLDCFSKVIDFMYSGEITHDPSHSEHLLELSEFLKLEELQRSVQVVGIEESLQDVYIGQNRSCKNKSTNKKVLTKINHSPIDSNTTSVDYTSGNCNTNNNICKNQAEIKSNLMKDKDKHILKDISHSAKSETNTELKLNILSKCADEFSFEKDEPEINDDNGNDEDVETQIKTGEFNCIKCKLNFDCFRLFNYHKKVFHKKNFVCLSCNYTTLKLSYMVFHLMNMDHTENYCSICLYEAQDTKGLKTHLQDHKSDFPYKCYICENVFRARTEWLRHAAVHSQMSDSMTCKLCGDSFDSKAAASSHILSHKEVTLHLCEMCGYTTPYKCVLERHTEKHKSKKSKRFLCPITPCTFSTPYKYNLKDHVKSHEPAKSFICEICSIKFTLEKNLNRHQKTMHNDKNDYYECCCCDYKNARLDKAKIHCEAVHANEPEALIYIMKQHHRKKELKLPNCGKKIDEKSIAVNKKMNPEVTNNDKIKLNKHESSECNVDNPTASSSDLGGVCGKKTFILSETTGEFHIISDNKGEPISVASVTSTNVLTIGNFREGTGSVTLNETTGILTLNNINSESTGAVFLNESTGELSYINLAKSSLEMDVDNLECKGVPKVQTQLNECTGEICTVSNENDIPDFNDDDGLFDSFDMDIGNEDSCDGFDDLDGLLFDPIDFENSDIFLSKGQDGRLTEIPHLNEATGELSFDHVDSKAESKDMWNSKSSAPQQRSSDGPEDSCILLLNEVTGELVTENVLTRN